MKTIERDGKGICSWGLIVERAINEIAFNKNSLIELLTKKRLIMPATFAKEYNPTLAKKF